MPLPRPKGEEQVVADEAFNPDRKVDKEGFAIRVQLLNAESVALADARRAEAARQVDERDAAADAVGVPYGTFTHNEAGQLVDSEDARREKEDRENSRPDSDWFRPEGA
jgi:hypothetical protein